MIHRGHGDHGDQGAQDGEGVHHVHHVEDTILCITVLFIFIPHNVGGVTSTSHHGTLLSGEGREECQIQG